MAIERRLTELAGPVGGKLHTARSRNDQVATDVTLYVRDAADGAIEAIAGLCEALIAAAERHLDWPLPGYTHLQRGQPVYLSHHLLAYVWMLLRDRERFRFVRAQADTMPLGAGALAGTNFDTDRAAVAAELGFGSVSPNSMDAVANRDYVLDHLGAAATCATHLSRLGGELVLWSTEEFGFVTLSDSWTSGSSIMPQKKNPDAAELLRAKAPRIVGHLAAMHGVLHALPLTYNKDLQEDKEHLFDAVDTLELCLWAARGMIEGAEFHRERMADAGADELIAATDLADLLVRHGTSFREAHGVVADLVRRAVGGEGSLPRAGRGRAGRGSRRAAGAVLVAGVQGLRGRHGAGARARAARRGPRRARGVRPAIDRDFFDRPVVDVARDLVGWTVRHGEAAGVIVETEAYHQIEPACHAYVGLTPRTATLFGPPGIAYVYRSYGIHALLNAVCEPEGTGAAVLIRALEPERRHRR